VRQIQRVIVGVLASGMVACAPRPSSEVAPRMAGHFENVSQLYAAAAAGQLSNVHGQATALLERETGEGMPEKVRPLVAELRAFAQLAATAPDTRSAASAVARLGGTCGACHREMKRGPRYEVVTGPPGGDSPVVTRMMRHQWASDRLWDGLVGPSDQSWMAGAAALRDAPLYTDALTRDVEQYDPVTKLAWTVHDVGARANTAHDRYQRADLYGDLLATCANCHQLLGHSTGGR